MTDTIESDVTEIIITAGEPPTGRRWIWRSEPLAEDVLTFGTLPDPRDARIAYLEAALREIRNYCGNPRIHGVDRAQQAFAIAAIALMPEPEASMVETVEELEA